jgi:DNA-binding MarR family transcriptional regulator
MDHQTIVDLTNLSNELMYRRFLVNNDEVRQFFYELTVPEYIALNLIIENEANDPIYGGKTYLSDLAERLQRPMRTISSIARNLRDKGFVIWSHDGDGEQGTYVTITEEGRSIEEKHQQVTKEFYGRVIEKFGRQNMVELLNLMKQLDTVMTVELENSKQEGNGDGEGTI